MSFVLGKYAYTLPIIWHMVHLVYIYTTCTLFPRVAAHHWAKSGVTRLQVVWE